MNTEDTDMATTLLLMDALNDYAEFNERRNGPYLDNVRYAGRRDVLYGIAAVAVAVFFGIFMMVTHNTLSNFTSGKAEIRKNSTKNTVPVGGPKIKVVVEPKSPPIRLRRTDELLRDRLLDGDEYINVYQ